MHEYSLMQQVIETIMDRLKERQAEGQRPGAIHEVSMKVGALDIHTEDAFRQAFTSLTQGTPLENAALNLTIEPAILVCKACGYHEPCAEGQIDGHDPNPYVECPRCGAVCEVKNGHGVGAIELLMD